MLLSVLCLLIFLLCMDGRPRPKKLRTDVQAAVKVLHSVTSTCSNNALKGILSGLRDGDVELDTFAPSMVRRAALARGHSMRMEIDMCWQTQMTLSDGFFWTLVSC